MRFLRIALAVVSLAASTAFASPVEPKEGAEFVTLAAPQPTKATGKKVEVIEFFMYHCPHCFSLEPHLAEWVKKQGDNVLFRRVHFASSASDPEAHLHLTLEAMGKSEEMHPKVLQAFHVEHLRLNKDAAILEWIPKQGIDQAKFMEYWNSFGVLTKLKSASQLTQNYKVDSAPTVVLDGRIVTSPSVVAEVNPGLTKATEYPAFQQTLDALVTKIQKEKGVGAAPAKAPAKAPAAPAKSAGK
ncbi:thiol:disulfide interchange protein DsbA/DsbL [Massilia antarctica]|uniref:Thiol:disulfide interchange protein DsbA n=1 Tax=Massilia antarctica TaxID=2765360 RepID=A0AA48WIL1_9BURK|nr:thiol:disulfide interchange protein DsbA/DsbL [Massilia antarctica]QPI52973.1 thiol:disulfide interchange protein DsbA/DsbL [Massilia antarctica]